MLFRSPDLFGLNSDERLKDHRPFQRYNDLRSDQKANVSVRRKKQFALIQPSTKTRIDLGLKLPGKELTGRLLDSGSFGTMYSHRVQLTDVKQVDAELMDWLREAYELAG